MLVGLGMLYAMSQVRLEAFWALWFHVEEARTIVWARNSRRWLWEVMMIDQELLGGRITAVETLHIATARLCVSGADHAECVDVVSHT